MPKAEPCLGYPSRTAAASALHVEGLDNKEIGRRIGRDAANVAALLAHAKNRGNQRGEVRVSFDPEVIEGLRGHAIKRGVTVHKLLRLLADVIIDDDLVDGILDDEVPKP